MEVEVMDTPNVSGYGQVRMRTLLARSFAVLLSLAVINITVPAGAMTHFAPDPRAPKPAPAVKPVVAKTRLLRAKEMKAMQGRTGENPYIAGQNKWDVLYNGVNLMTGNYSMSATDLTFEGGYGIPVNVTRSYSSNAADEGPLGKGWNLSADVRSTAGGLLKGPSAPVRSVPTTIKERPVNQNDPHIPDANEPVQAVIATDAGGFEETIQKDADGILTTPPWDKNRSVSTYQDVTSGGQLYQILLSNTVTTPDGTVYVYQKKGYYTSGTVPFNNPSATATPANVLKIVSATDRQGNVTNYTYGSGTVSFTKANGSVTENPLTSIDMPNGHTITFTWGNGTNAPTNRIRTASDGVRTVTYGYTSGNLTSVTTPAGKVTSYGYGSANSPTSYTGSVATNLVTSVTDPRGLVTSIKYAMTEAGFNPTHAGNYESVVVNTVSHPNGVVDYFIGQSATSDDYSTTAGWRAFSGSVVFETWAGGYSSGTLINTGMVGGTYDSINPIFTVELRGSGPNAPSPGYSNPVLQWSKVYDANSQNLLTNTQYIYPYKNGTGVRSTGLQADKRAERRLEPGSFYRQKVETTTTYNFQGNPLSKTVSESTLSNSTTTSFTHSATIGYAYWGKEKYYQQKAIKDQAGRYSYTDYFDSSATAGKKGQTYRVYDDKRTTFTTNAFIPVPSGTPSGDTWKYQLIPSDSGTYSAEFDYDSKGRPIDIWKLQSTGTSPWTYVRTHTTYGADSSPIWGAPTEVVEDYGSGKINRTTQTLAYDSIGRAVNVKDPAAREFETTYDLDGVIQSIYRVDGSHNDPIVTYTYGSSGLLNGVVTQVVDGLSGVTQDYTYQSSSGGGRGQVASITETNGLTSYSVSYTYSSAGDREKTTYATPNGTTEWKYSDYLTLGEPTSPTRAFQTLNKLNSGSPTSEEFQYQFDSVGRLTNAVFAQTPQSGQSSYSNSYPAATRARAYYAYHPAGRMTSIEHYWDTWGSSSYTSTPILGNACAYELSGANRDLKTQSDFYVNSSGSWALDRSETFTYDADLDYLTGANYNDGLSGATPSWTYDAAGNRNDASVVDNLNRATTIGGVSRTYDILGNTLTIGSTKTFGWDALNRMTSLAISGGATYNYSYRADGVRVSKSDGTTSTAYYYDGQMPVETVESTSSSVVVTRNTAGARGIDRVERVGGSTAIGYPIYDVHGNNVATLTKSGSSFSISDQRSYDAWGQIRQGSGSGDPKGRYTANLGHVVDDEANLIYMRARYYEAASGRFLSQDPAGEGTNWYSYCANNPVTFVDSSGRNKLIDFLKDLLDWLTTQGATPLETAAKIATLVATGIGVMRKFLSYAKDCETVSNGAQLIGDAAALDGATVIAAVAGSVAALARVGQLGCNLIVAVTFCQTVWSVWLVLTDGS